MMNQAGQRFGAGDGWLAEALWKEGGGKQRERCTAAESWNAKEQRAGAKE